MTDATFAFVIHTMESAATDVSVVAVPVKTVVARQQNVASSRTLTGTVEPAESVTLTSRVMGHIHELRVDEGDRVTAGAVRFRPILLTSVTTMLGTLSILNDPVWAGLAWALLGGMLTSSALTRFVIPLMYYGHRSQHQSAQDSAEATAFPQEALTS